MIKTQPICTRVKMSSTSKTTIEIENEYAKKLTDDFIQELNIKNPKVTTSYASVRGENYVGVLYRIFVQGRSKNGEDFASKYIIKIPPNDPQMRENFPLTKIFQREVYAYDTIFPEVEALEKHYEVADADRFNVPKCFKSNAKEFEECIILEDMISSGYFTKNKRHTLDLDHVKSVLRNLANFHAVSFKVKKCQPDVFKSWFEMCDSMDYYENIFQPPAKMHREMALNVIKNQDYKNRVMAIGDDMVKLTTEMTSKDFDKPYAVICHSDCWINNILFKPEEDEREVEACFIDWQMWKYASPLIDISYIIFLSTDQSLRKDHFNDLLNYYYESLKNRLRVFEEDVEELYPRNVFDDDCKKFLLCGLVMTLCLMPFILMDNKDTIKLESVLNKNKISEVNFRGDSVNVFEERVNGIVEDFVNLNLI